MSSIKTAQTKRLVTMDMSRYLFGQTPQFARADADADDMSKHQKTLCLVGQNAHVHDHGFHLATRSLATCALNVTTTTTTTTSTS